MTILLTHLKQPVGNYATGTGTATGTNTGDETTATIKSKLAITTLSGVNTGDQDLSGKENLLVSGTTIKTVNSSSLLGPGNLAVGDVTLAGTQTLSNKTLASPAVSGSLAITGTIAQNDAFGFPNSFSGPLELSNNLTVAGDTQVTGFKETQVARVWQSTPFDLATGTVFSVTLTGNDTFSVDNVPSAGSVASFMLDLTNGGAYTITWWAGIKWPKGTVPALTVAGRDVLGFFTYDGGTTWTGLVMGKDVK